jgi:hypothetical protein
MEDPQGSEPKEPFNTCDHHFKQPLVQERRAGYGFEQEGVGGGKRPVFQQQFTESQVPPKIVRNDRLTGHGGHDDYRNGSAYGQSPVKRSLSPALKGWVDYALLRHWQRADRGQ